MTMKTRKQGRTLKRYEQILPLSSAPEKNALLSAVFDLPCPLPHVPNGVERANRLFHRAQLLISYIYYVKVTVIKHHKVNLVGICTTLCFCGGVWRFGWSP